MERDMETLEITSIKSKPAPKRLHTLKVYGKHLNETIKFRDPDLEKFERMTNNLKRLNLNFEWTNVEELPFKKLKIGDNMNNRQDDPNAWHLKELSLK